MGDVKYLMKRRKGGKYLVLESDFVRGEGQGKKYLEIFLQERRKWRRKMRTIFREGHIFCGGEGKEGK